MEIMRLSCCNWGEIANLGYGYIGEPSMGLELMRNFIRSIPKSTMQYDYDTHKSKEVMAESLVNLYTIYLFSGVVNRNGSPFNGYAFAKFIEENKLGQISTTVPSRNLGYHAESDVQGWMWVPDQVALNKWVKENIPDAMKDKGNPKNNYWGATISAQVHKCAECKECGDCQSVEKKV